MCNSSNVRQDACEKVRPRLLRRGRSIKQRHLVSRCRNRNGCSWKAEIEVYLEWRWAAGDSYNTRIETHLDTVSRRCNSNAVTLSVRSSSKNQRLRRNRYVAYKTTFKRICQQRRTTEKHYRNDAVCEVQTWRITGALKCKYVFFLKIFEMLSAGAMSSRSELTQSPSRNVVNQASWVYGCCASVSPCCKFC